MKRFIIPPLIAIITLSSFLPFALIYAKAESGKYLRVITEDTAFYKSTDDNVPLFYLPYTYYVKPLNVVGIYTHVECYGHGGTAALDGYVLTDQLFDDGLTVINPCVVLELTTATTAVLYKDSGLTEPVQYLFAERKLKYYGSLNYGEQMIYYCSYNNRLGYVKESDVYPFSIANHPNELTFLPKDPPEKTDQPSVSESSDLFALKIVIILCLIFAGIVGLVIAFNKKPLKAAATSYYDDNDYE